MFLPKQMTVRRSNVCPKEKRWNGFSANCTPPYLNLIAKSIKCDEMSILCCGCLVTNLHVTITSAEMSISGRQIRMLRKQRMSGEGRQGSCNHLASASVQNLIGVIWQKNGLW